MAIATRKKGQQAPKKRFGGKSAISASALEREAAAARPVSSKEAEIATVKRWRSDHIAFVEEIILAPYNLATGSNYYMTEQQKDASRALTKLVQEKAEGKNRHIHGISIMSGKGTGKDAWTAWAILWFMTCFYYPKIPCTSVSADQLNKVLWSELSKWLTYSPLKSKHKLQNDLLYCADLDEPDAVKKRWFAFPKAANPKNSHEEQVEGLQGIHEDYMLQVIDEGSGVLMPVFNALIENQTGKVNLILLIFNPTRSKCYAVDTQYSDSDRWVCLRWNAEDSELVDPATIQAKRDKLGENYRDSNPYRISVLGLPPLVDEETLIPWDWIEDAVQRPIEALTEDPIIKGVDCGAGGDNSIIATRKGPIVYPMKRNKTADAKVLENWIGADIDAEKPDCVRIDTIGIGWAVEAGLRDKKGAIVEAADARRTSINPEKYYNKRAEMYWRLREAFERGEISIPNDEDLKEQLGAMRCEYGKTTKIVEKKKIKQDLGHSPDEADALALTFYYPDENVSRKRANSRQRGRDDAPKSSNWMAA